MAKVYPFGEGKIKWVSTEWLEDNLSKEDLHILDCQPNTHDYFVEHIPGAVFMSEGLLRVPLKGLPAQYIPAKAAQINFRRVGLNADIPVVVYTGKGEFKGWGDGLEQTMMAYSLARFGHNNIYVLDGGLEKWKSEGRKLVKGFPVVDESKFKAKVQKDYFLDYNEFRNLKDNDDVILLDARPAAVYEGQGPWMKPGHIPGAVNLPWAGLMDKDNKRLFKPDKEIQSTLESKNITRDKLIICSCGTGREATHEFILFKWYLGFPRVKIYEGSFTEWSSYPENPTVTGKNPR